MCMDPATMIAGISKVGASIGSSLGGLSTALSIAGTGISAYAQMQNAKQQAKVAEANAKAQEKASREAIEAGEAESDLQRRRGAAAIASQRTAMAANGVDVTGTDALDVLDDTKSMVEEDAFAIRENSRRQGQGMAQRAANYEAEAASARSKAIFQPVQTVLTGAAKVGRRYSDWAGENAYG